VALISSAGKLAKALEKKTSHGVDPAWPRSSYE
jgi:hypothetical protein